MRFRILGPFEVDDDQGREVSLGGPKQRAVLAILLLHAGEVVASDRLIDELWGERAPATAAKTIQVYVSNLRKVLGDGALVTRGGGYALQTEPAEVDAGRFHALVADGHRALDAGDPLLAARSLREALELWRGPPLVDFALEPFAQSEIARLEEARLAALEDRIDADLALGEHAALVGELEALVRKHPLRERLRGQLMLALYRAGRQTDALGAYRDVSDRLRDELGLEPGRALQELELAILRHDAALEPALRAARAAAGDLPVPTTPFLGRKRELAEVTGLLQSGESRLLTLTGAGGSGKTRLALWVATACATDYRDGAWFVGFAGITDPKLISPTICQALGLAEHPRLTPTQRIKQWLREREALLLLDNLEQLTPGAAVLGELLSECQGLTLLATSREPLHLAGEQQYDVPVLRRAEAIELFISRAQAIAPRLNVDVQLAGMICERLDYLPLAIELAAARTKALALAEILARLESGMPVLGDGPRDAPRRQRTLRATIDWSFGLLNPEERRLFTRFAVFAGGCTLAAAEIVCEAGLDTLQSLVDRSLVRLDGERYWMLRTLREYALERLEPAGEKQALRRAHAEWLIGLLHAEGLPQQGWPNDRSLARIAPERENFRAALEWASRGGMIETVARLAAPLVGVWVMTGQLHEATRWMTLVLEHEADYAGSLAAQVLSAGRALAWHRGDYASMPALSERALALWRELGDLERIGREMVSEGLAATEAGDAAGGRSAFQRAVRFARDNRLSEILAVALSNLGDLAIHEGRLNEGRALPEQSLVASERGSVAAGAALINLAHIAMLEEDPAEAASLAREALEAAQGRGDLLAVAWAAIAIAWPLAEQGDLERSARLLGSGFNFLDRSGAKREWMDESCEAAVGKILREHLDQHTVQALLKEGRSTPLEEAVREMLGESSEAADALGQRPSR